MKSIRYSDPPASEKLLKLKSGLAPTGVSRHVLVTTQQFSSTNIRRSGAKDKPRKTLLAGSVLGNYEAMADLPNGGHNWVSVAT
jgi:hypothetical protein